MLDRLTVFGCVFLCAGCYASHRPAPERDASARHDAAVPARDAAPREDSGPTPVPCQVGVRRTLVDPPGDRFATALAIADDGALGLLHQNSEGATPWSFRTFDPGNLETLMESVALDGLTGPVAMSAFVDGFAVVGRSGDRLGYRHFSDGILVRSDEEGEGGWSPVALARSGDHLLTVLLAEDGHTLTFSLAERRLFETPRPFRVTGELISNVSVAVSGRGFGITWVERGSVSASPSSLWFARIGIDGGVDEALELTRHDRYIYSTRTAFGDGRFLIASTDSRVDIGVVPLHATVLDADGSLVDEGLRLTRGVHYDDAETAYSAGSFAIAGAGFMNFGPTNEQVVFLYELTRDGASLREPLEVSDATFREFDCCVRARSARITAVGNDGYVVAWSQHVPWDERGPRTWCARPSSAASRRKSDQSAV